MRNRDTNIVVGWRDIREERVREMDRERDGGRVMKKVRQRERNGESARRKEGVRERMAEIVRSDR